MATEQVAICEVCSAVLVDLPVHAKTCATDACRAELARRHEARRSRYVDRGKFLAIDRGERLHALRELVRWSDAADEADARSERAVAKGAREKVREIVEVLGFDPLAYVPDRSMSDAATEENALGRVIARRTQAMLRRVPGTTSDLAEAAGIAPSSVRSYLRAYLENGELVNRAEQRVTWWEEPE